MCMHVCLDSRSVTSRSKGEGEAGKEKCWQQYDFISFPISCLGTRGVSWQRNEARLNTKAPTSANATQNKPARTILQSACSVG